MFGSLLCDCRVQSHAVCTGVPPSHSVCSQWTKPETMNSQTVRCPVSCVICSTCYTARHPAGTRSRPQHRDPQQHLPVWLCPPRGEAGCALQQRAEITMSPDCTPSCVCSTLVHSMHLLPKTSFRCVPGLFCALQHGKQTVICVR